jgi:hypothetical protein
VGFTERRDYGHYTPRGQGTPQWTKAVVEKGGGGSIPYGRFGELTPGNDGSSNDNHYDYGAQIVEISMRQPMKVDALQLLSQND